MEEDWSPRPPACCPLTRSLALSEYAGRVVARVVE
ncbi:hypothetical protein GQ607_017387 [Colletotrichum asianum]|uniref:Uncharacterized protein n=1 Tax=Colletotrichum asianum TaxID=702518 RepID=A0A8H3ZKT4_9PEZI|nr:hypothetical protein GQ607_017387 [Colletotrichum asianum]